MSQTQQAVFLQADGTVDFTAGSALAAGTVILSGNILYITKQAYASGDPATGHTRGQYRVKKKDSNIIPVGAVVFWDVDGNPKVGDAGTGAASSVKSSGDYILGKAIAAAASGDETVDIEMFGQVS